jgi:hypothetical protein
MKSRMRVKTAVRQICRGHEQHKEIAQKRLTKFEYRRRIMGRIISSVTDLIGNTPLLEVK